MTVLVSFATIGCSGGIDRNMIHSDSRAIAPLNR